MGARPMKRVIQEQIKRRLADDLLFGDLAEGGSVKVKAPLKGGKELRLEVTAAPSATVEEKSE